MARRPSCLSLRTAGARRSRIGCLCSALLCCAAAPPTKNQPACAWLLLPLPLGDVQGREAGGERSCCLLCCCCCCRRPHSLGSLRLAGCGWLVFITAVILEVTSYVVVLLTALVRTNSVRGVRHAHWSLFENLATLIY
jgi:hypothetical protein